MECRRSDANSYLRRYDYGCHSCLTLCPARERGIVADFEQEQILAVLDLNPLCAEEKCRLLWEKVQFFFRRNHASSPEDLTQEVFARANMRLAEGQAIYADRPESYFYGIARNILREDWKRARTQVVTLPDGFEESYGSDSDGDCCWRNACETWRRTNTIS
jgi:Sigma-70 region 2